MKSLNLLVVSTWFPHPPTNGSKLRAYHLLRELARRHRIHLLTFAEPGEESGASHLQTFCERVQVVHGNPAKAPPGQGLVSFLHATPRSYVIGFSREMQQLVRDAAQRADVGLALQIGASIYLRSMPALPRIWEEAEVTVISNRFERASHLPTKARLGLTWWKLGRFARLLVDDYDHTTVVSEQERAQLVSTGCNGARISVVPNGVDAALAERPATARRRQLVYPGAVTYSANLDAVAFFAREVMPLLRTSHPDLDLLVTGSTAGADTAALEDRPGLRFTGFVDDIHALVEESAVCVVPLREGGGTRLKILEAMALGTPVVSTAKGVEGLDVEPGVHALVSDEPARLAQHVRALLDDPELAARVSANARRLVIEKYTWSRAADLLNDVIDAVYVRRHTPARPA